MTDLTRRDPFQSLLSFPRWVSDLDDMLPGRRGLKINETDKDIVVEAVIAGVPAKDVEVHIEDGVLTIKAQKTLEEDEKNEYRSQSYQYYYTAALSGGQWDKAEAEVEDGIMIITIPKTEAAKPRSITVKTKAKATK
jgi:HSP20 family protein